MNLEEWVAAGQQRKWVERHFRCSQVHRLRGRRVGQPVGRKQRARASGAGQAAMEKDPVSHAQRSG